ITRLNPTTNGVVLSGPLPESAELDLFKAGVRGYCSIDIDPQLLKRVVVAIQLGELWIRRSLIPRVLEDLGVTLAGGAQAKRAVVGRLAYLTEREHEIAALVGSGGTN